MSGRGAGRLGHHQAWGGGLSRRWLGWLVVAGLAGLASGWLGYQFWRLAVGQEPIWPGSPPGAFDLRQRWTETTAWFAGQPVYGSVPTAVYPPASYAMLGVLHAGLPFDLLRLYWAGVSILALLLLGWLAGLAVGGQARSAPVWMARLLPAAMYAAGAGIGNGQLTVPVLAALLLAVSLLDLPPTARLSARREWAVAGLILLALVKPTVAAPFFWLPVVRHRTWPVAAGIVAGYLGLTWMACALQAGTPIAVLAAWRLAGAQTLVDPGYANLAAWARMGGLDDLAGQAAGLLLLAATGMWCWWHRDDDIWRLAAVCALCARLWTKHHWYDDLLLLPVVVALLRQAGHGWSAGTTVCRRRPLAGWLGLLLATALLSPCGPYAWPLEWRSLWTAGQGMLWLLTAGWLLLPGNGAARFADSATTEVRSDR